MEDIKEIISKILKGESEQYKEIVRIYGPAVQSYFRARFQDPHTVDDLAQEVFISAYRNLAAFRYNSPFESWLLGIARNKMLMYLRSRYTRKKNIENLKAGILLKSAGEENNLQKSRRDSLAKVQECMEQLPDNTREIIRIHYFEKERVSSIAAKLKKSVDAVSSLLYRGRKLLRTCLEGIGG